MYHGVLYHPVYIFVCLLKYVKKNSELIAESQKSQNDKEIRLVYSGDCFVCIKLLAMLPL